jgi:hypothetical protein
VFSRLRRVVRNSGKLIILLVLSALTFAQSLAAKLSVAIRRKAGTFFRPD